MYLRSFGAGTFYTARSNNVNKVSWGAESVTKGEKKIKQLSRKKLNTVWALDNLHFLLLVLS